LRKKARIRSNQFYYLVFRSILTTDGPLYSV
jgi:hypothetical protein